MATVVQTQDALAPGEPTADDPTGAAGAVQATSPLAIAIRESFQLPEADSIRLSNAVFDEAGRGASEAATEVVVRGLVGFGAVSVASILGERLFSSTIGRMGFTLGASVLAVRFVKGDG